MASRFAHGSRTHTYIQVYRRVALVGSGIATVHVAFTMLVRVPLSAEVISCVCSAGSRSGPRLPCLKLLIAYEQVSRLYESEC